MKTRILVADDDLAVRESLAKILRGAGHEVLCAANGEEAERLVANEPLDLLLLDLGLPTRGGWNVFGLATALRPLMPVVILTGLKDQSENKLLPGIAAFLEKPVEVPLLLQTIAGLLAEPEEQRWRRISAHPLIAGRMELA
jgi:DNA-binding NtrC family response regulator